MSKRIPVWIDCDTGVDDAIALMMAMRLPSLDIVGISSVAGNAEEEKTYRNARKVVSFMGKEIPVYHGAEKPLMMDLVTAPQAHGEDGLGGAELPESTLEETKEKALDAIYQEAKKQNGLMELVAVGPLTNLALCIMKYPDLKKYVKRILIMGGSTYKGNVTPSAEFNIYTDPHAAETVFQSGIPVYMFGLDVTLNAYLTQEEYDAISNQGNELGKFFHDSTQLLVELYERYVGPELCVHDACPLLYLEYPELFEGVECGVHVETEGKYTQGKTICDLHADRPYGFKNAVVMTKVNREEFAKRMMEHLIQ